MTTNDLVHRFMPFESRYRLWPASYRIQNSQGEEAGWVASVRVVRLGVREDVVQTLSDPKAIPPDPRVFATEAAANAFAFGFAVSWLEKHGERD